MYEAKQFLCVCGIDVSFKVVSFLKLHLFNIYRNMRPYIYHQLESILFPATRPLPHLTRINNGCGLYVCRNSASEYGDERVLNCS